MKSKHDIISEILESGAKYVTTTISPESCAVSIAIRDIENVDDHIFKSQRCEWSKCSTGLD